MQHGIALSAGCQRIRDFMLKQAYVIAGRQLWMTSKSGVYNQLLKVQHA